VSRCRDGLVASVQVANPKEEPDCNSDLCARNTSMCTLMMQVFCSLTTELSLFEAHRLFQYHINMWAAERGKEEVE